ncbi:hypothetical protein KQX54_021367 [Cotesia glomerata]|uniref:Uncharacterized protein n=1 Tax=Cotesia glomerata TaxID=32391 RepID=A0AAV7J8H7_COTGL|nr:hypothetical protein KQX54_021367 [Cotesia glomerata]
MKIVFLFCGRGSASLVGFRRSRVLEYNFELRGSEEPIARVSSDVISNSDLVGRKLCPARRESLSISSLSPSSLHYYTPNYLSAWYGWYSVNIGPLDAALHDPHFHTYTLIATYRESDCLCVTRLFLASPREIP